MPTHATPAQNTSGKTAPAFQSLARALTDHSVDTLFGLMGDANLFAVDHYVRACGGRFVPSAHEGSSVLMALAYAQVTGKIGVASITHGPALTNCVTALTEGARGHIPMVLLAGDTPVANPRHLQSIDQREVVKSSGAGFEQVRAPETISADLARAFYRARVERRPIVLNIPADFMWQDTLHESRVLNVFDNPNAAAEGDILDEAIGMIASARRPLILAGGGAIHARDQLIRLADRLEVRAAFLREPFGGQPGALGLDCDRGDVVGDDVVEIADEHVADEPLAATPSTAALRPETPIATANQGRGRGRWRQSTSDAASGAWLCCGFLAPSPPLIGNGGLRAVSSSPGR